MDSVTAYAKKVVAGKIVAGKKVIQACKRHLDDLKKSTRKDYPYYFDEDEAVRVFDFSEIFCRHSKGKWAGQPVILEEWQKFCVGSIFGWKKKKDDTRRFQYFYIQVAKKNGKSTLMAVIGIYVIVCDGEGGAEIYSAATTRNQAKIIFDESKRMVKKSPQLNNLLTTYTNNISFDETASFFRPLASDADNLDGLNVHLALIDELHAHKSSELYDNLDSAKGAREQPIIGVVTTAGLNPQSFCKEKYDQYANVLKGTSEGDDVFIYISEIDEGDDWTDENVWIKANPNLGVSVYIDDMRSMCKTAKEVLTAQNSFKCKKLDMWVSSAVSWVDIDKWKTSPINITKESLIGRRCYIGCDLANRNDIASVVAEFPLENNRFACLHHSFIPEDRIYELSKQHNVSYQAWIDAGYMTATPGSIIDYDFIEAKVYEWAKLYGIVEICLDPWQASQLEIRFIEEGFTVVEVRQGTKTLSEPTKDLGGVIHEQRITHYNDPVLSWAIGNVVVSSDENENIKPNKKLSRFKIDPAAALINAHTRAYTDAENYVDINKVVEDELEELQKMLGGY